ncbi:MAG: hypothetical protein WD851_20405 [Pirellulales bacterium]
MGRFLVGSGLFCIWLAASSATAKDHFLTIGGGPRPDNNQVSLERNVLLQQQVLAAQRLDKPAYELYFADGSDEARDLQYRASKFRVTCPPARRMMAEVLGDEESMDLLYRNHQLPNVEGPSDPQLVRRRMRRLAKELQAGDRLIVYATAHGGKAKSPAKNRDEEKSETNKYDTSLYFWESETVAASEFAGWLDRLSPEVTVVLVMVQCYAGGFAHTIFHEADADLGLAPHARCGFFAQVHDRGAAGCTPDVDEADYQEYSTFFWSALGGRSRTGETIDTADYDQNGTVSFAEAHAYAVIESDTVDVPVRTSDELLRKYSELGTKNAESAKDKAAASQPALLELAGSLTTFTENARPEERAILEGLSKKLQLEEPVTIEAAREKLKRLKEESDTADGKVAQAKRGARQALTRVQNDVYEVWPELKARYSPVAMELTSERADEFVKRVEEMSSYAALLKAREREDKRTDEQLDLLRQEAKVERLLRTAENVALATNLPHVAPEEIVARYDKLRALEDGTLAPQPSPETSAQTEPAAISGEGK